MSTSRVTMDWLKLVATLLAVAAIVWQGGEIKGDLAARLTAVERALRDLQPTLSAISNRGAQQGADIATLSRLTTEQRAELRELQRYMWGFAPGDEHER